MSNTHGGDDRKTGAPDSENRKRPISLSPVTLKNERAHDVPSVNPPAREARLVPVGDHSQPAREIAELGYTIAPVGEVRPAMRLEQARRVQLHEVAVSSVQMRQLRERRIAAKELLPLVPGLRVRVR